MKMAHLRRWRGVPSLRRRRPTPQSGAQAAPRIWTLLVALLLVGGAGVVATSTVWAQSNEVVVVTSFPKEVFEGYKRAFEGVTPGVKVVIKQQQTNQGVTYLRETRAKPDADVFWVSSVDAFLSLKQDGCSIG